jgi:hypothetical protein
MASSASAALVAYFPLDGTNGAIAATIDDVIDDATHDVTDGTANNNLATWVTDGTRGSVLNSPTGNRFLAGTQDINVTAGNGFTWSFWAKSGADTAGVVIGTRNGTWHKLQFGEVDGTGFADFRYSSTGTDNNNETSTANFGDGSWHHVAYVGDENGVAIYIDGVKSGGDTSLVASTYNGQMEIGGSTRFSEYVDVQLDDLAIWDEALTEARIIELAAGGSVIPIPEPSSTALLGLGGLALILRRRK